MIEKVEQIIRKEKLIDREDKVLVAVSGGVDSMVLLYILAELGIHVAAAHVNFKLRQEASEEDQIFVIQWCEKRNIPCHTTSFETRKYLIDASDSVQMVARRLRYDWMEKLMKNHSYTRLAVGHHVNDSFETTIYNLVKGTGIKGVRGIKIQSGNIIRPLISFNKEEIIAFARENNIPWREDQTNVRSDYYRNYIRNEIVPKLKTINPSLESTFFHTQNRLNDAEEIVSEVILFIKDKYISINGEVTIIDISWIESQKGARYILSEILADYGFNYRQSLDVYESRDHTGKYFLSEEYRVLVDRGKLEVEKKEVRAEVHASLEKNGNVQTSYGGFESQVVSYSREFVIPDLKNIACLDAEKLSFPLSIRNWQQGDRFMPLGMKGFKKVSDFLIDEKVSFSTKEKTLVIESDNEICWVVGHRPDERFKISENTEKICLIKTDTEGI